MELPAVVRDVFFEGKRVLVDGVIARGSSA